MRGLYEEVVRKGIPFHKVPHNIINCLICSGITGLTQNWSLFTEMRFCQI